MKRSELLEIIKNEMLYNSSIPEWEIPETANHILYIIEEKGMQPPKYLKKIHKVENRDLEEYSNEWEPEDEKK